jgi:hypothetical protein
VDALVDLHSVSVKTLGEGLQDAPDSAAVVWGEADAIKQVVPIAGVGDDGRGEATGVQVVPHAADHIQGQRLLAVGRRHLRVANWVGIDQEPAATDDISIFRQGAILRPTNPVGASGLQVWLDGVKHHVNAARL